MNLFKKLWDVFSLDDKTIHELIEISTRVDIEKSNNGFYTESVDDLSQIASVIVALLNEKSTAAIGRQFYTALNKAIVHKNASVVRTDNGKKALEQVKTKETPGTFRVRNTRAGYRFDLVASTGEHLASSEVYSTLDSCTNGIESMQRYAISPVEDQTENGYKTIRNPKYEIYVDKAGEYRFRLKLMNGQIIAVSEGYSTKESCLHSIERIKIAAKTNDIEKR